MIQPLATIAKVQTAVVFRDQAPQEAEDGNVRALAIRDLVSSKPLRWHELPKVSVADKYLAHCLQPGDVVLPSRGDYYKAYMFTGADSPVLPVGQLNVVRPFAGCDAGYLVWYFNLKSTQAKMSLLLAGTNIKALTKASLLSVEIEVPTLPEQRCIADLDQITKRIIALRHRLSELNEAEVTYVTKRLLNGGGCSHA